MPRTRQSARPSWIGGEREMPAVVADPTSEPYLVQVGRRAMACRFQVYLHAGQQADVVPAALAALDEVDRLESVLSVYRADSEVAVINQTAFPAAVAVSPEVMELLQLSLQLHAETSGAFDVTAGPLSETWGIARSAGRIPTSAELEAARARVGSAYVEIDEQGGTVGFRRQGVQLNFGGIGKGYALDIAARALAADGVADFLFHGGRSSVIARGDSVAGEGGWKVGLIHPRRPQVRLAEVRVRDRALSTSGSQMQSFQYRGRRWGHILDPRTGWPCDGLLSVTVLAATAARADALSTALFVMGAAEAADFCERHPEVAAILVLPGAGRQQIALQAFNLSDEDWQVLETA